MNEVINILKGHPKELLMLIAKGINYKLVEEFANKLEIKRTVLCRVMGVSERTLQRLDGKDFLKPVQTEKFLGLVEVYELGLPVFGDREKFNTWLHTENFALSSLRPIDIVGNAYGKEMVLTELNNIEHGIFA